MIKAALVEAIIAFGDARATNNQALILFAGKHLQKILDELPDELGKHIKTTNEPDNQSVATTE